MALHPDEFSKLQPLKTLLSPNHKVVKDLNDSKDLKDPIKP